MLIKCKRISILAAYFILFSLLCAGAVCANSANKTPANESLSVAVAANFIYPIKYIAEQFEAQCKCRLRLSFGSSGKLFAQIQHGAPFDVFLSADSHKPKKLVEQGKALGTSRFTYARGRLVLWSPSTTTHSAKQLAVEQRLKTGEFRTLAMANPQLAPYGSAAQEVLEALALRFTPKVVTGENIAQTFQFVRTGNADMGFIALAQLQASQAPYSAANTWEIPADLYQPINQDAVLLKRGEHKHSARQFLAFLKSPPIQQWLLRQGYGEIYRE